MTRSTQSRCALVGLFYLANDYIALGTSSEDYLIVPRSLKFNYPRLSEIIWATGLDKVPESSGAGIQFLPNADRDRAPAN